MEVGEGRSGRKALGYALVDVVQMLDNSAPLLPDQARPIGIVGAPR